MRLARKPVRAGIYIASITTTEHRFFRIRHRNETNHICSIVPKTTTPLMSARCLGRTISRSLTSPRTHTKSIRHQFYQCIFSTLLSRIERSPISQPCSFPALDNTDAYWLLSFSSLFTVPIVMEIGILDCLLCYIYVIVVCTKTSVL